MYNFFREGRDTLISLISRFDRTPQEKIKIIITGNYKANIKLDRKQ